MSETEPAFPFLSSRQTLTVLSRLALRKPQAEEWLAEALTGRLQEHAETALEVAAETGGPIGRVLAELVSERARPELAERLMRRCNERDFRQSVPLLEVAEAATRRYLVCLYSSLTLRPDASQIFELALTLGNLGSRKARLGQSPEALRYHQEALDTWKSLAATHGIDEVLLNQAVSLSNIGQVHGAMKNWEEALAPTEESVRQLQQLVDSGNEAAIPHLAVGLRNLGIIQSELARHEEALASNAGGLRLQDALAAKDRLAHLPERARDLTNLAGRLREAGRLEEALPLLKEALEIRRELASERPKIFLPDLALSLNNLGVLLHEMGRDDESLAATFEAVELRRQLAEANPEAFLELLARSLYNLSNRLSERDRIDEALDVTGEAIACYQLLLDVDPQRFLPNFADRLTHYHDLLERLGHMEDRFLSAQAGLRLLLPYIDSHRVALNNWIALLLGDYLSSAAATGRPRDETLYQEVLAAWEGHGTR